MQIFDQLSVHFIKTTSSSTAKSFVSISWFTVHENITSAARMTKNVGAFSLSLSILHCRELFVRHAIQCPGYFRGVEEGENAKCLITEHEHAQGNNNNNN